MTFISMFLKFGKEEDIIDLCDNGTIYMNPIQRFREIEDGELRGDLYEGINSVRNYEPGQFEIPQIKFKGNHLGIHLRESYERVFGNIYSLYCISSRIKGSPENFSVDQKIKRFGSHCLMIKNNEKFLELIIEKLKGFGFRFDHGFVDYYDKNKINRRVSLFEKPIEFEYQKEFRFYIERFSIEPFYFRIGSLASISQIYQTSSIVDGLKLQKAYS